MYVSLVHWNFFKKKLKFSHVSSSGVTRNCQEIEHRLILIIKFVNVFHRPCRYI